MATGVAGTWIFTREKAGQTGLTEPAPVRDGEAVILEVLKGCFEPGPQRFAGSRKTAEEIVGEQITQTAKKLGLSDATLRQDMETWALSTGLLLQPARAF